MAINKFKQVLIHAAACVLAGWLKVLRFFCPVPPAIYFCYNQCIHHIHHTLYIAIELSNLQDIVPVVVLSTSREATEIITGELSTIPNRVKLERIRHPGYDKRDFSVNWFVFHCRLRMDRPLAVVVTDYYDNVFRQLLLKTFWVHVDHGVVNRAYVDPHLKDYDLAVLPGEGELEETRQRLGPLSNYEVMGYPKMDYFRYHQAQQERLFDDARPVVLYNPHFQEDLTSFFDAGHEMLKALSDSGKYNVIFLPHPDLVRKHPREVENVAGLPRVACVSRPKINLVYMAAADLYITDVSSAVFEWLVFDKPVVFFNTKQVQWQDSPYYKSWRLGQVVEQAADMLRSVDRALAVPDEFQNVRRQVLARTFANRDQPVARNIARTIAQKLGLIRA